MLYPVNEIFESIQGEGFYTGRPSVFIRLQGCDVGCPWCDTPHTWDQHAREVPLNSERDAIAATTMSVESILVELGNYSAGHVVITGGEPATFKLAPLVNALLEHNVSVQVETSGTYLIDDWPLGAWLTVSPKIGMLGGRKIQTSVIGIADEIKMPVGRVRDIIRLKDDVLPYARPRPIVFLQPLSLSKLSTQLCIDAASENGWNVSIQTHKYIGLR